MKVESNDRLPTVILVVKLSLYYLGCGKTFKYRSAYLARLKDRNEFIVYQVYSTVNINSQSISDTLVPTKHLYCPRSNCH
jgi:hypothetical protein